LSQILQGYGSKSEAEYWRQIDAQNPLGCVFGNTTTSAGMSWSSVDYFGRLKAAAFIWREKFLHADSVSGWKKHERRND